MSHLLDCSGLLDSGGRASPLGRPHPVSYPVSKLSFQLLSRLFLNELTDMLREFIPLN